MVEHYIVAGSSYQEGKRIAIHKSYIGGIDLNDIEHLMDKLKKHTGITYSVHYVVTDSNDWSSVVAYDSFFKEIVLIEDVDIFAGLIEADHKLMGIDIAKYLIAKYHISDHMKLEKLVYYCYADYLCLRKKQLFDDYIYAFRYGPVEDSVFSQFKGSSKLEGQYDELATRSRFMVRSDGKEILQSIDDTMHKYGHLNGVDLMNLTHQDGTPWQRNFKEASYKIPISDADIVNYHSKEELSC